MASISGRRRKAKTGTTAVPFLITILISMIVLGSIAYYFYGKLTNKERELQPMQGATTSISDADIYEILFVLQPDQEDRLPAVMLLRFDPVRKQEFCVGIPINLILDHDGRQITVRECLENHGVNNLKNDLSKLLDQQIDRYIQLDSAGFQKLVGLIGNVSYLVTIRDTGLRPEDTSQLLDGTQFETLLTSKKYYSEEERSAVIGFSVAALLNQCDGKRISTNLDGYFSAIINTITTDVTAMDFSEHRHAISYVFEHANGPGRGMSVLCERRDDDTLVLSEDFVDSLKVTFSQKKADEDDGE